MQETVLTATELRRNLFQVLDRAARGENVDVSYKGAHLRITAPSTVSKLSRLTRRKTLLVDPFSIVGSDQELLKELDQAWRADDARL